jgi:hypothetical protein
LVQFGITSGRVVAKIRAGIAIKAALGRLRIIDMGDAPLGRYLSS